MQKVIPCFYSEYGRYISRFRAMPLFIDALKPVERRLLLSLKEKGSVKLQKSAKVVGHCMGEYHPHGDSSLYGSLVDMVQRGLAVGEGNWGVEGLDDDPPAAMRYTETKAQKWVNEIAFKYCNPNYMEWKELELESEPLYLPSPLPIGLIGQGIIQGISFYTTHIPRYKFKDLKDRLIWLLKTGPAIMNLRAEIDQDPTMVLDPNKFGPIIKPDIKNCGTNEIDPNAYYSLLTKGHGAIKIVPNGTIDTKQKIINILGKPPLRNGFQNLRRRCDGVDRKGNPLKKGKINARLKDFTKSTCDIAVYPSKPRSQNLNDLAIEVWSIISPNINFNCQYCDFEGKLFQIGVDDILLTGYQYWVQAVINKHIYDVNKLYRLLFELHIIHYIRQMNLPTMTTIEDIVAQFKSGVYQPVIIEEYDIPNKVWNPIQRTIMEDNIRTVCSNKSIKQLIEVTIDFQKIHQKIQDTKANIQNNDNECFTYLQSL